MSRKEQKPIGLNIGSASIIMIFAVLCLTVFSALSFVTAASEKSTADRFAESTAAYYEADAEAERIRTELIKDTSSAESLGVTCTESAAGMVYSYAVPVDDGISQLSVVLRKSGEIMETVMWEKTNTDEWTPDTAIELWDVEAASKDAEEKQTEN
jgi:hypothetical protein